MEMQVGLSSSLGLDLPEVFFLPSSLSHGKKGNAGGGLCWLGRLQRGVHGPVEELSNPEDLLETQWLTRGQERFTAALGRHCLILLSRN